MLLEPLRGKDDCIDLREKNGLVEHNPTDFWLLIKRISSRSGFNFHTLDEITVDQ